MRIEPANCLNILPRKLTWQWKIHHLKMYSLLEMGISQCHVSFQGCIILILEASQSGRNVRKMSPVHKSWRWSNYRRAARHVLKRWGFKSWAVMAVAGRVYKTLEYVGKGPVHSQYTSPSKKEIVTGPPCSCQILLRSPFFDRGHAYESLKR